MRLTLSARVFLHGLALLISASVLVAGIGRMMVDQQSSGLRQLHRWMVEDTCARLRSGRALAGPLPSTHYDDAGWVLATTVSPPLPPLSTDEVRALPSSPAPDEAAPAPEGAAPSSSAPAEASGELPLPGVEAFRCAGVRGYVVVGPPRPPPAAGLPGLGVVLVSLLALVGLASFPLARSLVGPLTRLVEATRRLGAGELSTRVASSRTDELGELARAFDAMAERVAAAARAQRELLANVSHELRTPLSRIRVVLELAEDDPSRTQALLAEIRRDLADLERLIDAVLEAARHESRAAALPLELVPTEPASLLTEVADAFRTAHPERTLTVECEAGLPRVSVDARLLRRVLDNLLENSRRYTDGPIWLLASSRDGCVVLRARDVGEGLEGAELERVFSPFYRVEGSRSRATGGVGLGLSLARSIVERHGGTLTLESTRGVGTTAIVRLPWSDAKPQ